MRIFLLAACIAGIVFIIIIEIYTSIAKRVVKNPETKTNCETLIGKTGVIKKKVSDIEIGEILVCGTLWKCVSKEEIEVGQSVSVCSIEGNKLLVTRVNLD